MKRIILGVAAMLMTFALGVGVYRVIWVRSNVSAPIVEAVPAAIVQPVAELVPVVTPVQTVPTTPENRIVLNYDDETFYPNGTYFILGQKPNEFADFYSFETDYSEYINERPVGFISVMTKGHETYDNHSAVFGLVSPRRIVFITALDPATAVEYLFDGEFIRRDFDMVAGKDKAVVRGTLTKMKHGKKVAEHILSFRMVQHGC